MANDTNNDAKNVKSNDSLRNKNFKAKELIENNKKPVLKTVLDSPYNLKWPSCPPLASNSILKELINEFETFVKSRNSGKYPVTPENIIIGINNVTKLIENDDKSSPKVVLVCKSDINPQRLISHFPLLIASKNSNKSQSIVLIELPKSSEEQLSVALKIKRIAVIAFDESHPLTKSIIDKIDVNEHTLKAPWLNSKNEVTYIPTNVQQVQTHMPANMKLAKEERKKERQAKKERIANSLALKKSKKEL